MRLPVAIGLSCAIAAADPARTVRLEFPSKRSITAPVLAGTYEVAGAAGFDSLSYTEVSAERGIVNAVVMTSASAISCADARSAIENAKTLESEPMKRLGVSWYVSYPLLHDTRRIRHACLARKTGCIEVTIDEPAAATRWPELEPIAVAMLAARK